MTKTHIWLFIRIIFSTAISDLMFIYKWKYWSIFTSLRMPTVVQMEEIKLIHPLINCFSFTRHHGPNGSSFEPACSSPCWIFGHVPQSVLFSDLSGLMLPVFPVYRVGSQPVWLHAWPEGGWVVVAEADRNQHLCCQLWRSLITHARCTPVSQSLAYHP